MSAPSSTTPTLLPGTITPPITLETRLQPGDLGRIIAYHGCYYVHEAGFDPSIETTVAAEIALSIQRQQHHAHTHPDSAPLEQTWVARESGGHLVGTITLTPCRSLNPDAPWLDGIGEVRWFIVDPQCQGLGVGKELLSRLIDRAKAHHIKEIFLWTAGELDRALGLYERFGFSVVERLQDGRYGPGLEAVRMRWVNPDT